MIYFLTWVQIEWLQFTKNLKNETVYIYLVAIVIPYTDCWDWLISNFAEGKLCLLLMTLPE